MRQAWFGLAGALALLLGAVALDRLCPPDLSSYREAGLLVLAADGRPIAARGSADRFWRFAARPGDADPDFIKTLLATEDRRFWLMPGVDPVALLRAALQDARAGRVVSGGSSLTMQVARLLSPHRRTPWGKSVEILRALQLSVHFSKTQILAMYLTLAPYGGNIEGVQAASWLYFGHDAEHLSQPEIALLVALPRRPEALRPDRHPVQAALAVARIYAEQHLGAHLGAPPAALAGAIHRGAFPAQAPYLAQRLWALGRRGVVITNIDARLQTQISRIARDAAGRFGGGADVAVLLLRNDDAAVAAYAGGAGVDVPGGYVDMIQAIRSPGSTLKPFIYGMAFDRGIVTPATLIDDTPIGNATYDPADFDRAWHGVVPVAVALQQSYNLPAVKILQAVGPLAAVTAMRHAGMAMELPKADEPSLAVALGGVGVRLNDLCALYAGLADGAAPLRLRLLRSDPKTALAPVMTMASARDILSILEGMPPPDGTSGFGSRAVAYKTGTSYGFRDAWSIGVSGDWTVGVWVGRADGTPRPGSFGLNTAAPLMADVFALLPADQRAMPEPIVAPMVAPMVAVGPMADAAPALAHFGAGLTAQIPPRIIFPPPGAMIEVDDDAPVALQATGGAAPYRWIVDGTELPPPPPGEDPFWQPPSSGFFRLTAIDQQNDVVSEMVEVR